MSSLQLGLLLSGMAVIALLLVHGAWVAHRHRPRRPKAIPGEARREFEPIRMPGQPTPPPAVSSAVLDKRQRIDALIDVVVPLPLDVPLPGRTLLAHLPHTRRVGSKPLLIEAMDVASGEWVFPEAGGTYSAVQSAIQLANRKGALNEIEFSEFVMKIQAYADALGATPEFPDMLAEVARARELDEFIHAHDAQIAVCLRPRGAAWSPGYVVQQATCQGFVSGNFPGHMLLPSKTVGVPALSLLFDTQAAMAEDPDESAIFEVKLLLDVPHVPRDEQLFMRLGEVVMALAREMQAVLTDEQGERLLDEQVAQMAADLDLFYDALEARDLAAGSAQARRLFT